MGFWEEHVSAVHTRAELSHRNDASGQICWVFVQIAAVCIGEYVLQAARNIKIVFLL